MKKSSRSVWELELFWLLMGRVSEIMGGALLIPVADGLFWHETDIWAFLVPSVLAFALGGAFCYLGRHPLRQLNVWEGALFMVLVWPVLSVFGMMPYVLTGVIRDPLTALFESVAAVTTTGLSCYTYQDFAATHSLMLWHSLLNWLGGLNFILILTTVLPQVSGCFGLTLSARQSIFFSPLWNKMASSAWQGFRIYAGLTIFSFVLFLLAGLMPFDAITGALVTLSSSGTADPGLFMQYDLWPLELATGVSMVLASLNPLLCWKSWQRRSLCFFLRDTEMQVYLLLLLAGGALIALNLSHHGLYDSVTGLRYGFFQAASFLSTCGFVSAPCWEWPPFSRLLLFVFVFIGGCIGSAGGGIKVIRFLVLLRMALAEVRHTLHPHMVVSIKVDGLAVPAKVVGRILSFFFLFLSIFALSSLVIALSGLSMMQSMGVAAGCLTSAGSTAALFGQGNLAWAPYWLKLFCAFLMVLGRIEIFSFFVLLDRGFRSLGKNW
ncbi:TrkH family potassium uptake protein [Mitsuokella sp.]|uniref:TrkH family potassium uptake protein n=1 Tax=Mitsuokella TaxID=52225 RepID=UPI002A800F8A|nr:potassium transporter TrkG [Mitsuokella sp.]MDY4474209.1 potassium transporter TrkG [Mitsuokella sp.]